MVSPPVSASRPRSRAAIGNVTGWAGWPVAARSAAVAGWLTTVDGLVLADGAADMVELVAAVGKIESISRAGCRRYFEERFTTERMVDNYERVYRRVMGLSEAEFAITTHAAAASK